MINFTPETLAKCSLCIETRHGWYKKETHRSGQYYIVKFDEKQDGVYFAHDVLYRWKFFVIWKVNMKKTLL